MSSMNTTTSITPPEARRAAAVGGSSEPAAPAVEVVIPVYNEERDVRASVRKLHFYMRSEFAFPFRITIVDNASTDSTLEQARALARELAEVQVLHLERKGRGRALRAAW